MQLGPPGSASAGPSAVPLPAQPLITERLSDRLASLLAAQLDSGALTPGDRLPTEARLAVQHGVSRTVVREAVHQLKSRGLLRSRQGSGVFVTAPPPNQSLAFDPKVLESVAAVIQVVELRRVLEGEIAALAAQRATREQIRALKRSLLAIDSAMLEGRDGVDEDMAFHRAIAEATGNPQFSRLLAFLEQYLREAMRVTKGNEARHEDFMQQVRCEHSAIVAAIAARDADAARRCATEHLQRGQWRLEAAGVIPRRKAGARIGKGNKTRTAPA
ncbi:MAG: FadR family transcriptional regulator [Burkholderiales bacterium]|nr:FadR family transcriptional regulator [Burkholderiales bacterium]